MRACDSDITDRYFSLSVIASETPVPGAREGERTPLGFFVHHARVRSIEGSWSRDREIERRRWSPWFWSSPSRSPRATRPRSRMAPMTPPDPKISVTGEWKYNTRISEEQTRHRCSFRFAIKFTIESLLLFQEMVAAFYFFIQFLNIFLYWKIFKEKVQIYTKPVSILGLSLLSVIFDEKETNLLVQIISKPLWASKPSFWVTKRIYSESV